MAKCSRKPKPIGVMMDGTVVVAPVDPCLYVETERHTNVTVTISKCAVCGELDFSWSRTEDTKSTYL